jgi:hypothetical protein
MDDLVLNYVARIVPPQRLHLYLDCHTLLTARFPEGWKAVLDTIATHLETKTINDIEYLLHNAMITNLISVIQEFGVYVNDRYEFHTGLRQLYYLADGLYLIENYPNVVALRTLFDAHTSAHDRLGYILAEVKPGFDIDNFYGMVSEIADSTMLRLDDTLTQNLELVEPLLEQHGLTTVVQDLITQYASEYPAIAELPFQNITGTMDAYVAAYRSHILASEPAVAARILVICAVMAGLTEQAAREAIGAAVQHIYRDHLRIGISVSRLTLALPYPEALQNDPS